MKKEFSLILELFESEEAARFFCATFIGLLTCLREGSISLSEAEGLLFSPRVAQALRGKGVSSAVCDLIMECCELDDILTLIPDEYNSSLDSLLDRFSDFLRRAEAKMTGFHLADVR